MAAPTYGIHGTPYDSVANTYNSPHNVAATRMGYFEIEAVNRNATSVTVRIAVGSDSTNPPADEEHNEYDAVVQGNTPLIRTKIVGPSEYVWVRASATGVGFIVSGVEQDIPTA